MNDFALRLIRHAARNAPPSLSERLEEEWLADLSARQGTLSRVLFGLGCCWATIVIAREHYALNIAAATSTAGSTTMTAHAQPDSTFFSFFSRRTTAFVVIVALHVAVIYAFATGLVHGIIEAIPRSMETTFLPDTTHDVKPPPPTEVDLIQPQKLVIVERDIPFDVPPDPTPPIRDVMVGPAVPPPVPTAPKVEAPVKRVLGGPGKGFPNSADYYPAASRRLGEQGSATIHVCADAQGRLTEDPTVAQSSGMARIDEGALKLAKAGSGHYRATTENGVAVNACYPVRFTFEFRD